MRMLMNNLDPEVAERPEELVVYGGRGQAARDWDSYAAIVSTLQALENDETLLIQSGKPVAVFRTHLDAPRVLLANSRADALCSLLRRLEILRHRGTLGGERSEGFGGPRTIQTRASRTSL